MTFRFTLYIGPNGAHGEISVTMPSDAEMLSWFDKVFGSLDEDRRYGSSVLIEKRVAGEWVHVRYLPWGELC